jgi:hypothetical protein
VLAGGPRFYFELGVMLVSALHFDLNYSFNFGFNFRGSGATGTIGAFFLANVS